MNQSNVSSEIERALERANLKLEDALAYAERYGPSIKSNPELCVRLYFSSRGLSLETSLQSTRVNEMEDEKDYKASLVVAEELDPIRYTGCPTCTKKLGDKDNRVQAGERVQCESKRCKGTEVEATNLAMRKFWAGDESGMVQIVFGANRQVEENLAGKTVTVSGGFSHDRKGVPSIMVNSYMVKSDEVNNTVKDAPLTSFKGVVPPANNTTIETSTQTTGTPKIDESKQKTLTERVTSFVGVYKGKPIPIKIFERWFNVQFPGVDYKATLNEVGYVVDGEMIRAKAVE